MAQYRLYTPADGQGVYEIYRYYVQHSTALFDLVPLSLDDFMIKMEEAASLYPVYVMEHDHEIIGYAYVHPAFSKEAYRYCVELTIYFRQGPHYGLADPVLKQIESDCQERNIRWIISCITDSNQESIAFHEKHGYRLTGALPSCGYKFDAWHGVVWMCKNLANKVTYKVAKNATVIGDVTLSQDANVWYGAIVRGDSAPIHIGKATNIQDLCVLHVDPGHPLTIGDRVTIGHKAIVHGACIEDEVLIGMGAIIMNGAHIESHCIIGAGALIPEGMYVPGGSVVVGCPGKVIKPVSNEQIQQILNNARHYVELSKHNL